MNPPANAAGRLERLAPILLSDPDNLPLHRECVELAMRGGDYMRALEFLDFRLSRHPAEAEALFTRSNALIGLQRFPEAIQLLQSLEQQGAPRIPVLQNLATCHYLSQQFENAATCTEQLIAAGEKSAGTLHLAISSLHHLGRVDDAVALADANKEILAANGALAAACALLFIDVDQPEKARRLAGIALAQNPDSVDALTAQATLDAADLDNEQALRRFTRVSQLAPLNGRAWLGLGLLATLDQDFTQAKELLKRATELMPEHVGSWHARAWAHLFAADPAGAEQFFAHALELDRNFGESHGAMAAMLAMKGDRAGAEREIELAERLDRRGLSSQFARSVLLGQDKGADASRDFIRDAIKVLAGRFSGRAKSVFTQISGSNANKGPPPKSRS